MEPGGAITASQPFFAINRVPSLPRHYLSCVHFLCTLATNKFSPIALLFAPLCARYPSSSYFVARHLGRGREHRGNAIRKYWML
jgi:hypothetical protein